MQNRVMGQTTTPSRDNLPSLWSVASRMPSNTWRSGVADGEIRKRSWDFGNGNQPKTKQELVVSSISSAENFFGKMGSRLMSMFSNWQMMECHKCVVATSKPFKQTCNIGKHKNSTMNCICIFPFSRNGFAGQYYLLEFTYFLFWLCQWRSQ